MSQSEESVENGRGSEPAVSGTRQAIVLAARDCIRQYGLQKTTVSDIARVAGLSRATIYQHFRDKAEIIEAAAQHTSREFYDQMAHAMAGATTVEDQFASAAVFVRTARSLVALEQPPEFEETPVLFTAHAGALLMECVKFLEPYLAAAKERGEVRESLDTRAAAEWFARILFSLYGTPMSALDMDDPRVVRGFVKDHLLCGFAGAARSTTNEGSYWAEAAAAREWVATRQAPKRR